MGNLLTNWKAVLGGIGGVLVIILQIINTITTNDIDSTLVSKAATLQQQAQLIAQKTDAVSTLVHQQGATLLQNGASVDVIKAQISALQNQLQTIGGVKR